MTPLHFGRTGNHNLYTQLFFLAIISNHVWLACQQDHCLQRDITPRVSVSIKYLLTNTSLFILHQLFPPVPLLAKSSSCVRECVNKVSMFINLLLLNPCSSSCQFVREDPPVLHSYCLKTIRKSNFSYPSHLYIRQIQGPTECLYKIM